MEQVCIYTVSPVSRVVFETTTLKNYTPILPQNSNTHSDTRKHRVWVKLEEQRRHRDAAVCDLKFVNELQTHTCIPARTQSRCHTPTNGEQIGKICMVHFYFYLIPNSIKAQPL